MSRHLFSAVSFAGLLRAGDSKQFTLDLKTDRETILVQASAAAISGTVDLKSFQTTIVKGRSCVSYNNFHTHLVLRAISRHLKNRLRISIPSRDQIIKGVIEALFDRTPAYAIRRDISSFYESVAIGELRDRLIFDTASSILTRSYIKEFFDSHCASKSHGLPRGVGLSALLAEMAMRDFDTKIRSIPGVFRYFRFSDDILIFALRPEREIADAIEAALPKGMTFNLAKSHEIFFSRETPKTVSSRHLEYLGYKFSTEEPKGKDESRRVRVAIADRKIKKLKTRIILSLIAYTRRPNWKLLQNRLQFLTGNYSVRRQGVDTLKARTHVLSGVHYNYRLCGKYSIKAGIAKIEAYDCAELKALDGFMHSVIRSHFRNNHHNLSLLQIWDLETISFYKGYELKIRARFSGDRVAEIKRAWRNV